MRTFLLLACLGLASSCLTSESLCDSVSLGAPVPLSAKLADQQSFCARAPAARHFAGYGDGGPACPVSADGGCDSQLYSLGEVFDEGSSGDTGQCCLVVAGGAVIRKYVAQTY